MVMKFTIGLVILLYSVVLSDAFGMDVRIEGGVRCVADVSGPGESAVQHSDCTVTRSSEKGNGDDKADARPQSATSKKPSAGSKKRSYGCAEWNHQSKEEQLTFVKGKDSKGPTGKTKEAEVLIAYIQGGLDIQKRSFDVDVWDKIGAWCDKDPEVKLSEVLRRLSCHCASEAAQDE